MRICEHFRGIAARPIFCRFGRRKVGCGLFSGFMNSCTFDKLPPESPPKIGTFCLPGKPGAESNCSLVHVVTPACRCMSPTSAMSDVYKARDEDLRKCDDIFKPLANQVGLLAFIGGKPAGADLVSLTSAYAKLHPKLVRSYALEALLEDGRANLSAAPSTLNSQPSTTPPGEVAPDSALRTPHSELARAFLAEIASAEERQFASVGHGTDFRYRSAPRPSTLNPRPSTICGTALVHENEVIHAAFFQVDDPLTLNSQPSTNLPSPSAAVTIANKDAP